MPARLDSLTSLRFFAAVLVVLSHLDFVFDPGAVRPGRAGYVGMGFFFLLSDFVLTWSHQPRDTSGAFYRRRFARVYPMHLISLFIGAALVLTAGPHLDVVQLVTAVGLLHAWLPVERFIEGANPPSWSLSAEAFFYACFPSLLAVTASRSRRGLLAASGAALGWVALGLVIDHVVPRVGAGLYVFPPYRIAWFFLGIVLCLAVQRGWRCPVDLHVALGLTAVGLLLVSVRNPDPVQGEALMLPA